MNYTIDAKDRTLGRVASEAAALLMGKSTTTFVRNRVADVQVTITNASALRIHAQRKASKVYTRHTGYPGGLRTRTLEEEQARHGVEGLLRKAVSGMLPKNKLQSILLKQLVIAE